MNRTCPVMSLFASHFTCPFLIMCIDSYPAIVFSAPLTERNHRLAAIRFLMNRWSCSTMLFKYAMGRHRQREPPDAAAVRKHAAADRGVGRASGVEVGGGEAKLW